MHYSVSNLSFFVSRALFWFFFPEPCRRTAYELYIDIGEEKGGGPCKVQNVHNLTTKDWKPKKKKNCDSIDWWCFEFWFDNTALDTSPDLCDQYIRWLKKTMFIRFRTVIQSAILWQSNWEMITCWWMYRIPHKTALRLLISMSPLVYKCSLWTMHGRRKATRNKC